MSKLMPRLVPLDMPLFLISAGSAPLRQQIQAASDPWHGSLVLRAPSTGRPVLDLEVARPGDLAAFADLERVALIQPAVVPLALASANTGKVIARIAQDPLAHRLAQRFLAALNAELSATSARAASRNPVGSTG